MLDKLILLQKTITDIQHKSEVLEKYLNEANPEDEVMAEFHELANIRKVSLIQLKEELKEFAQALHKFTKLRDKLKVQIQELDILIFVRYIFIIKEISDKFYVFFPQNYKLVFF